MSSVRGCRAYSREAPITSLCHGRVSSLQAGVHGMSGWKGEIGI